MNKSLKTRLDHFLGKVAGRKDANIATLSPPVATNTTEQLLSEIADRLDNMLAVIRNVPYATGEVVTAEEFNGLIDALIEAGAMQPSGESAEDSDVVGEGRVDFMILKS